METKVEKAFLTVEGIDVEVTYDYYRGFDFTPLNQVYIHSVFVKGVDIYDIISRSAELDICEQIRDMERETKENRGELV